MVSQLSGQGVRFRPVYSEDDMKLKQTLLTLNPIRRLLSILLATALTIGLLPTVTLATTGTGSVEYQWITSTDFPINPKSGNQNSGHFD